MLFAFKVNFLENHLILVLSMCYWMDYCLAGLDPRNLRGGLWPGRRKSLSRCWLKLWATRMVGAWSACHWDNAVVTEEDSSCRTWLRESQFRDRLSFWSLSSTKLVCNAVVVLILISFCWNLQIKTCELVDFTNEIGGVSVQCAPSSKKNDLRNKTK